MSDFRNRLRREVVDPARDSERLRTYYGKVIKETKLNDTKCNVSFINEEGKEVKKDIKIEMTNELGKVVPKIGDAVVIERDNNDYAIIRFVPSTEEQEEEDYIIDKDKFSSMPADSSPGTLNNN